LKKKEIAKKQHKIFIDFEASGFGDDGYPISVAWGSKTGEIKYFVISNIFSPDWKFWCEDAEEIHGLSEDFLKAGGVHPLVVCNAMLDDLRGKSVYAQGAGNDRFWLERLMSYSGEKIDHNISILEAVGKTDRQIKLLNYKVSSDFEYHHAKSDVRELIQIFAL